MQTILALARMLWRQRRSANLLAVSAFLWIVLTQDLTWASEAFDALAFWPAVMLLAATTLIAAAIVAISTALLCALVPPFRGVPVVLSASWPVTEIGDRLLPLDGSSMLFWQFAVILFFTWLFFFPHVDRWLPLRRVCKGVQFRTRAHPHEILDATIPGLGSVDAYYGNLHDVRLDPDRPDVRRVRYALGRGVFEEQIVTFKGISDDGGTYHHVNDASPQIAAQTEGTFSVSIGPAGPNGWRKVGLASKWAALPLRLAFLQWLFDTDGERADSVANKLNRNFDPSVAGRDSRLAKSQA